MSTTALAALAALEAPRSSMIALPRLRTIFMKSFSSQFSSLINSETGLPQIVAFVKSGNYMFE